MSGNYHKKKNTLTSQETFLEDTVSSSVKNMDPQEDFRIKPKIFLVYLLVIALAWGIRQAGELDLEGFFNLVEDYPVSGPIIFIMVYALLVALLIPTLPVNLAAGVVWGGMWGGVWATLGSALGAVLAFRLARTSMGKPFARKYDNRLLIGSFTRSTRMHGR